MIAIVAVVGVAGSVLSGANSSSVAAAPRCDAACEVNKLGWRIIDGGPPLWFETKNGFAQVAVANPGRPTPGDEIRWAVSQLAGSKGAFGPLQGCHGNLPSGGQKVTLLSCTVAPGTAGPRQAGIFVVQTDAGLQLIGMIMGANVKKSSLNFGPLQWLASESGGGPAGLARAVRAAIAMCLNEAYYIAPDAGAGESVEAVYHYWNWQNTTTSGLVDQGSDFVLFKNGEVWRNPGAGPRDIDRVKFKEARWNDWGVWRKQAGGLVITLNGLAPTMVPANKLEYYAPASSDHAEGQWRWQSSYEAPFALVNREKLMKLHADGRFELNASAGAIGLPNYAAPGLPRYPGTPGASNHNSGHYRIDGYTLRLAFDNGQMASGLFYWAGDGKFSRYAMFLLDGASWLATSR